MKRAKKAAETEAADPNVFDTFIEVLHGFDGSSEVSMNPQLRRALRSINRATYNKFDSSRMELCLAPRGFDPVAPVIKELLKGDAKSKKRQAFARILSGSFVVGDNEDDDEDVGGVASLRRLVSRCKVLRKLSFDFTGQWKRNRAAEPRVVIAEALSALSSELVEEVSISHANNTAILRSLVDASDGKLDRLTSLTICTCEYRNLKITEEASVWIMSMSERQLTRLEIGVIGGERSPLLHGACKLRRLSLSFNCHPWTSGKRPTHTVVDHLPANLVDLRLHNAPHLVESIDSRLTRLTRLTVSMERNYYNIQQPSDATKLAKATAALQDFGSLVQLDIPYFGQEQLNNLGMRKLLPEKLQKLRLVLFEYDDGVELLMQSLCTGLHELAIVNECHATIAFDALPLGELNGLTSLRLVSKYSYVMNASSLYVALKNLALTELVVEDVIDPELDLYNKNSLAHVHALHLSGRYNLTPMRYVRPRKMRVSNIGSASDRYATIPELFEMQLDDLDTLSLYGSIEMIGLALPRIGALAGSLTYLNIEIHDRFSHEHRKLTNSFVKSMVGELIKLVNLRELTICEGKNLQQISNAKALSPLSQITSLQSLTLS